MKEGGGGREGFSRIQSGTLSFVLSCLLNSVYSRRCCIFISPTNDSGVRTVLPWGPRSPLGVVGTDVPGKGATRTGQTTERVGNNI